MRAGIERGREGGRWMCFNVLFDMWMTSFYVLAIMESVHIAWNGCITGNLSPAG